MTKKIFKVMLLPNKLVDAEEIPKGTYYVSTKLDGIRSVFMNGEMVSRSLKQIRNKQLQEKFQWLKDYSKEHNCVIDGELYYHDVSFQIISSLVMTEDFLDGKKFKEITKNSTKELTIDFTKKDREHAKELLTYYNEDGTEFNNPIGFYSFDYFEEYAPPHLPFDVRKKKLMQVGNSGKYITVHPQTIMELPRDTDWLKAHFRDALDQGYEGLIVKNSNSPYKFGRATIKENYAFKFKEYITSDAIIFDIVQATVVISKIEDMYERLNADDHLAYGRTYSDADIVHLYEETYGAIRTTNEMGRSVTSKKKDDRILIDKASAFWCTCPEVFGNNKFKVSLAMSDEEKIEIWNNPKKYIGEKVEFKYMMAGSKIAPRHPVSVRMRFNKDDE